MLDRPGHLQPVYTRAGWMELVYKSDLPAITKLVASVVSSTCTYQPRHQMQLSEISDYTISRITKTNQDEVRRELDLLFKNGWLWDTGQKAGSRKIYGLTFSLVPLGEMRE